MIRGCLDILTNAGAVGWAFSDDGCPISIVASCENEVIGRATPELPRPDVKDTFPASENSAWSGFALPFDFGRLPPTNPIVCVSVAAVSGAAKKTPGDFVHIGGGPIIKSDTLASLNSPPKSSFIGPLPRPVMDAVNFLWPNKNEDLIERFTILTQVAEARSLPAIANYVQFLRTTWSHFRFVHEYFPHTNAARSFTDKDFHCQGSSPEELMSIANHLYVLRSYGVTGDFAEFGCFKGFSSSMLSYACGLLGIRMHVFDSFDGLPSSPSHYYSAGDFRGSFDEVCRNVAIFGDPGVVMYHRGYFADSLSKIHLPKLMSIWMDVDLESSAAAVMGVAQNIDDRGAIFSHECLKTNFTAGGIVASRSPESVIPPILDRFAELRKELSGAYLSGFLGAFWRKGEGIPVLPNSSLQRLLKC
jgi:O-methyltransferase